MSTGSTHETGEAAASKNAKKSEGDMLRSRNNTKDQTDEKDDEIKAFIEERRNLRKIGQRTKNVSKQIKKCIRDKKIMKCENTTSDQKCWT